MLLKKNAFDLVGSSNSTGFQSVRLKSRNLEKTGVFSRIFDISLAAISRFVVDDSTKFAHKDSQNATAGSRISQGMAYRHFWSENARNETGFKDFLELPPRSRPRIL